MGSQSSSGMSGRGSSGNPDQSEPESNQIQATTPRSRRGTERTSASEEDVDLAQVLAYLLRRWLIICAMCCYRMSVSQTENERSDHGVSQTGFLMLFCCRGQVRLVHGSGATGLQLVQSISDSDEDSDGAWEGRLGHRYDPPGNPFQRKHYFHSSAKESIIFTIFLFLSEDFVGMLPMWKACNGHVLIIKTKLMRLIRPCGAKKKKKTQIKAF